jgi:hypothetical protein
MGPNRPKTAKSQSAARVKKSPPARQNKNARPANQNNAHPLKNRFSNDRKIHSPKIYSNLIYENSFDHFSEYPGIYFDGRPPRPLKFSPHASSADPHPPRLNSCRSTDCDYALRNHNHARIGNVRCRKQLHRSPQRSTSTARKNESSRDCCRKDT